MPVKDTPYGNLVLVPLPSYVPGQVAAVIAGANVTVDNTDPTRPVVASTAAAAGLTLIQRIVLAAPAASIDFTSIPATYENLVLKAALKSTGASLGSDPVWMQFNGDGTVANYNEIDVRSVSVNGGGAGTVSANSVIGVAAGMRICEASATVSVDAVSATYVTCSIPHYKRTVWRKYIEALTSGSQVADQAGVPEVDIYMRGGCWKSTAAINRITLTLNSGANFATGSVVDLYGEA